MPAAELALAKTFVDLFATSSTYDGPSFLQGVTDILSEVDAVEAPAVALAYSSALRLVSSDLLRWRAATDVAVQLDLFEVLPTLLDGVRVSMDVHQLENLAALVSNPGVPESALHAARSIIETAGVSAELHNALLIRIDPFARTTGDLDVLLQAQSWPGLAPSTLLGAVAPTVYVATQGNRQMEAWHAIAALGRAGARVRRIPPAFERGPSPEWLGVNWPMVFWSNTDARNFQSSVGARRAHLVICKGDVVGPLATPRFLNMVEQGFPAGVRLRRHTLELGQTPEAFSPETLTLGAFDAAEMRYLGAASRTTLSRVSRQGLEPASTVHAQRWAFNQLVTLRILQTFKSKGMRLAPDAKTILDRLSAMAEASEQSVVGIDGRGTVYVDEGEGFRALGSNQIALEPFLTVDQAFRPFEIGGGIVPNMLRPSRRTAVHPATMGGTPTVEGKRIAARGLALLERTRGHDAVRSAYPELSPADLTDATAVGRALLSVG